MKNIYRKLEYEAKNITNKAESLGSAGKPDNQQELERRKTMLLKDGVGDLDEIGEFGLGIAPRYAKPVNKIEISKVKEEERALMEVEDDEDDTRFDEEDDEESKLEIIRLKKKREKKRKPIDKQTAFIEYKTLPEGKEYED